MSEFNERLVTHFSELSEKIFKRPLDIPSLDRFHKLCKKLASDITLAAEHAAIKKCKALNDAVKKAFGVVAEDMAKLEARIEKLEAKNKRHPKPDEM